MVIDDDFKEVIEFFTAELISALDLLDSAKGVNTSSDQEDEWEEDGWDDDY